MLESLYAGSVADAERRRENVSLAQIENLALSTADAKDAVSLLRTGSNLRVIAEIKRASPSKGKLAEIPDPAALGLAYESSGAAAISVLTEERSFLGSLQDFDDVRERVSLPLLRKDFIANEYQVLEARAHGADIVLLIVAGLKADLLIRLKDFVESLGMTAFIETHSRDEVDFAADINSAMVGINARDLTTFETDRSLFASLVDRLPKNAVKVAESAVRGLDDASAYAGAGADCVLVGEALVKGDSAALIQAFSQIPKA